jgi:hypothetical protein
MSREQFERDFTEMKFCGLLQSELEVKAKNYWLDQPSKYDKTNSGFFRKVLQDNIIKETIEIPKSLINTKNKVVMINTLDKNGFLFHSKLCLFGKMNIAYLALLDNTQKEKKHKVDHKTACLQTNK